MQPPSYIPTPTYANQSSSQPPTYNPAPPNYNLSNTSAVGSIITYPAAPNYNSSSNNANVISQPPAYSASINNGSNYPSNGQSTYVTTPNGYSTLPVASTGPKLGSVAGTATSMSMMNIYAQQYAQPISSSNVQSMSDPPPPSYEAAVWNSGSVSSNNNNSATSNSNQVTNNNNNSSIKKIASIKKTAIPDIPTVFVELNSMTELQLEKFIHPFKR